MPFYLLQHQIDNIPAKLCGDDLIDAYFSLRQKFSLTLIEDPLHPDDREQYSILTRGLRPAISTIMGKDCIMNQNEYDKALFSDTYSGLPLEVCAQKFTFLALVSSQGGSYPLQSVLQEP